MTSYDRTFALDDVIVRSRGADRTVEAYATVFDQWTEIRDQHGHYHERIARTAFDEVLRHGIEHVGVFYNHGLNLHGTPSGIGSVPIGSPVDIRPDGRGLRTVTRFNRTTLADMVFEAIGSGDIKGYSFRGAVLLSDPARVQRARAGSSGVLPRVTRVRLGLTEYGPTPSPAYTGSAIIAVRTAA